MAHFKTENKLALSTFLSQGSIVIFNFTLVYYLRECGIDSVGIGLASSIYPTLYFLGCIFMPKLLPSLKGKARILAANIGMAFTGLVLTFIKNEALIMTDLVFYGLFQSLLWTNMETWITGGKEGGELTSRLTLFNFSWSFSVGLATSFSGFVSEYSTRLSIWSGCVFFLISALLVALSGRSYDSKKEKEEIVSEDHSSPLRFPSWAGVLLVYTGYSLVLTVFPQYAMDTLGYSESVTGNILLFRGISVTIAFLIMQKARVWQKGVGPILGSQAFFAILTFLMLFLRSIAAFAILFAL
ncbi:MAG: MFS transporter, partial [Candidatus Ornithospirochaeta sp.]